MKYNIWKNWAGAVETLSKNPVIFGPFIIIAFLECLVLEAAYFSTRFPLSSVLGPIIKKFVGESFMHYPNSLMLVPRLFYYAQMAIYIAASVFLTAIAVQIFVNIRTGHPVILKAIIKNLARKYPVFVGYGLIYIILMAFLDGSESFVFLKGARYISHHFFKISDQLFSIGAVQLSFLSFVLVQAFLILTVPIIVTEKKNLFKAILGSIAVGARNILKVFLLALVPFLFYLPVIFMKNFLPVIMNKTFPEISFYITLLGIITAIFIDCFAIISLTQFLLDTKKTK